MKKIFLITALLMTGSFFGQEKVGKNKKEAIELAYKYWGEKEYKSAKKNVVKYFSLAKRSDKDFARIILLQSWIDRKLEDIRLGVSYEQEKEKKEETKHDSISDSKPASEYVITEEVPSYPGCTGNNLAKRRCTDINIRKFIGRNFNVQRAKCLEFVKKYDRKLKKHIDVCKKEIKNERVRIKTIFVIDTLGYITDITAQSPYSSLNTEAKRVLKSLPAMKPGKQRGRKVRVRMALPIQFKIQ